MSPCFASCHCKFLRGCVLVFRLAFFVMLDFHCFSRDSFIYIYILLVVVVACLANLYIALDFRAFTASLLVSLSRWILAVKAYYLLSLASSVR